MEQTSKNKNTHFFQAVLLALAGSFIYALSTGIRNNYGIMMDAVLKSSGISFVSVSFVFAVGQFVFGLVQPAFGILAVKRGNTIVLVCGALLMMAGMLLTPVSQSMLSLILCLGIILPAGTGALGYGIIMGTIIPKLPAKWVSAVSGIVNACSGIGNTVMSPLIIFFISVGGLMYNMAIFSVLTLLIIPLAFYLGKGNRGKKENANNSIKEKTTEEESFRVKDMFREVFQSKAYMYLLIGFFTCGFHMAIITNHLPTEFGSYGFDEETTAYAFSVYGIVTMMGSIFIGTLCGKYNMKNILGGLFLSRPFIVLLFFLLPKSLFSICLFAGLLGFTGASTVPPVSGIVGKVWGAKKLSTLFGFLFVAHQIGAFLSAWLGGVCFQATNSYTLIWVADIALGFLAAAVSFMIREKSLQNS